MGGRGAVGLLILRVAFGLGIMLHGLQKLQNDHGPLHWMGENAPVPEVLQGLSVLAEFGGGIAIVIGLLTPLASFGLTCNMLVALFMVHVRMGHPFLPTEKGGPSFEPALDYLAVALCLLITGPGCLSLDGLLFRRFCGKCPACSGGA
jgi:putative oxidoreductase